MQRKTHDRRSTSLSRGPLLWSGEHWILYLRPPGSQVDSGQLSPVLRRLQPRGPGNGGLYRYSPAPEGLTAVCTDNPRVGRFYYCHYDSRQQ